jgi:uncharacterized protein (TIGR00299 family) protein
MLLGALIDLGVPIAVIADALDAIGAGHERLRVARVVKHGVAAIDIKVDTAGHLTGEPHGHTDDPHTDRRRTDDSRTEHSHGEHSHGEHSHGEHSHAHDSHGARHNHSHGDGTRDDHPHVHYAAIRARVMAARLTDGTRRRALDIFDRLARAEAKMHGKAVDDVVFHEVGAIDSVVDVVGTAAALDWLAPAAVTCTSVAMGHGTLRCAHGVLPVPAPAALEILREAGGIVADGGIARELCTPTGAAVLASAVTRWTAAPMGRPLAVGWGAGDADLADRANVLRVVVIDVGAGVRGETDVVWQLDANIDDMNPELCGPASEAVFAAGALDVWWTPITMKKGRPALMLSALAAEETRAAVAAAVLRETTTIGIRYARRERTILARTIREVATAYGPIAVKVACDGDVIVNVAPELDACVAAARRHGVPVKLVFAAAVAAYETAR